MWTPQEVRKLIAQIAGSIFGIAGVILIIKDIKATGHINVSSKVLSGQIETGSAGLFLIFISFLLILIPAIFPHNATITALESINIKTGTSEIKRMAIATVLSFILTLLLILGGDYLLSSLGAKSGGLLIFGGILSGMVSAVMFVGLLIVFVENGNTVKSSEDKTNNKV